MHAAAYNFVRSVVANHGPFDAVVEIGARNVNGTIRGLFFRAKTYVGTDISDGPGVDVVVDGADFTPDFTPDAVVCCETLEHTADAEAIVRNMVKIVAPGGFVIVTCAGPHRSPHSAVDGGPLQPGEYYGNVHPDDLKSWLESASGQTAVVTHDYQLGDVQGYVMTSAVAEIRATAPRSAKSKATP